MLENLVIRGRDYKCAVRTLLYSLSEADQEILRDNLMDFKVSSNGLSKALLELGGEDSRQHNFTTPGR